MKTLTKMFLALLLVFSVFTPINSSAAATEEVELELLNMVDIQSNDDGTPYSDGKNPSMALMDNGKVINVYEGSEISDNLYYRFGEYKDGEMDWSEHSLYYGGGKSPVVKVLDNGHILEMHEVEGRGNVSYKLGTYNDDRDSISWYGPSVRYIEEGEDPSIEILDEDRILTLSKRTNSTRLWYNLSRFQDGKLHDLTIESPLPEYHVEPHNPSVMALEDGTILATHESASGELYYLLGTDNEDRIDWLDDSWTKYADGKNPTLTLMEDGHILNVYEDQTNTNLYYRLGEFKDDEIDWNSEHVYDRGWNTDVLVLDNGKILSVNEVSAQLYGRLGHYEDGKIVWEDIPFRLEYLNINDVDPDHNYALGEKPAITVLDNGLVLAIKESSKNLGYQLGEYHDGEIYWTKPVNYDTGTYASVSTLPNGDIMEIHLGPIITSAYYNLGKYEDGEINWYSIGNKYDSGRYPNLTVLSTGNIVALTRDSGSYNSSYKVGTYNDRSIEWDDKYYRYGANSKTTDKASITELNDGRLLGSHQDYGNLEYMIGNLTNWNSATVYEEYGKDPVSLQLDNDYIVTLFEGTRGDNNPTWTRIGEIDSSGETINWITNTYNAFNGSKNDMVQLQNGFILNVNESPDNDSVQYRIGRWDEPSKMVKW